MDEIDRSLEQARPVLDAALADVQRAKQLDNVPFIEGECECCANDSKRLVLCVHAKDGNVWACAPCRDKLKLPVKR